MSAKTNLGRVGLVPRGEYDGESSYRRLDFVVYEGSSYVALKDTQGVTPADGETWLLLAERGARGADGLPGKDGMPGEPGKDGKSYVILGPVYPTEEALRQAVTAPNEGDRYEVGTEYPYDVYRCTGEKPPNDWVNDGPLTGGGGEGTVKTVCGVEPDAGGNVPLKAKNIGAVTSVNGQTPDESGNVTMKSEVSFTVNGHTLDAQNTKADLTAADVGARPDDWMPTQLQLGFQRGTTGAIESTGANSYKDITINFNTPYSSNPHVIVSLHYAGNSLIGNCLYALSQVTKSGFTIRFCNASSSGSFAPYFSWMAIGTISASNASSARSHDDVYMADQDVFENNAMEEDV